MAVRVESVPEPGDLEVVVGPMRRRHLRGVLRIEHRVYPRPWSMGLFMSELGFRAGRVYLVARVDGAVVGYGGLMLVQDDGHVTTLAVDPEWHRHGIGARLLLALGAAAVERGARNLTLEVRIGNRPAQELYRRFGFVPAGIRKGYYVETNEDALVMWANDIDGDEHRARVAALAAGIRGRTVREELDR
jgi:[ribosomal protein S18]-alanine N-acetyltransferase